MKLLSPLDQMFAHGGAAHYAHRRVCGLRPALREHRAEFHPHCEAITTGVPALPFDSVIAGGASMACPRQVQ